MHTYLRKKVNNLFVQDLELSRRPNTATANRRTKQSALLCQFWCVHPLLTSSGRKNWTEKNLKQFNHIINCSSGLTPKSLKLDYRSWWLLCNVMRVRSEGGDFASVMAKKRTDCPTGGNSSMRTRSVQSSEKHRNITRCKMTVWIRFAASPQKYCWHKTTDGAVSRYSFPLTVPRTY